MKLIKLTLENFKTFKKAEFKFKKITILAGANSAGKSTVMNALAALSQGEHDRPFPFYFSNFGKNVHLGGFKDILNKNAGSIKKYSIELEFSLENQINNVKGTYRYSHQNQQTLVDSVHVKNEKSEIKVEHINKTEYKVTNLFSEKDKSSTNRLMKIFRQTLSELTEPEDSTKRLSEDEIKNLFDEIQNDTFNESINISRTKDLMNSIMSHRFSYDMSISGAKRSMSEFSSNISYIGPIRPYPLRQYLLQSYTAEVGSSGESAFQILISWAKNDSKKFNKVKNDLKSLELASNVRSDQIKDELVEINVTPYGQKFTSNISDVGFGLSQVLPIIVANTCAKKGAVLLVNQPEVHLHPSSQALLANYFTKESKDKGFVIETHSEYLINRFRLLVAQNQLSSKDISIIYIGRGEEEPYISNISIDKNGSLINAPEEFFDTYFIDNHEIIMSNFKEQ